MSKNNILLKSLINPALPEPVSWFPQTIAWQVLALLGLFVLCVFIGRFYQQFKKNSYRRSAMQAIIKLQNQYPAVIIEQLHYLLKMNAIHAYPHIQVAPMQGQTWLQFLDNSNLKSSFNNELTQKWQSCLYKPFDDNEWDKKQIEKLILICQCWIRHHHPIEIEQIKSVVNSNKIGKKNAI